MSPRESALNGSTAVHPEHGKSTTHGLTVVVVVALAISAMGIAWISWAVHELFNFGE